MVRRERKKEGVCQDRLSIFPNDAKRADFFSSSKICRYKSRSVHYYLTLPTALTADGERREEKKGNGSESTQRDSEPARQPQMRPSTPRPSPSLTSQPPSRMTANSSAGRVREDSVMEMPNPLPRKAFCLCGSSIQTIVLGHHTLGRYTLNDCNLLPLSIGPSVRHSFLFPQIFFDHGYL